MCRFLPYNEMNQPCTYVSPLLSLSSLIPASRSSQNWAELPVLCSGFPLAVYFTHGDFSTTLSIHLTLSCLHYVHKSILCLRLYSVQFSRSVMSDSLQPHELQHARPPCASPTPRVHSNSCPSSRWCHPAISSSVVPFSSCPQSLPASESFPMSTVRMRWPKYWSFSFSIIPSKEHPGLFSFRMD